MLEERFERCPLLSSLTVIIVGEVAFAVLAGVVTMCGGLQCFAPQMLRQVQKKLRPKADWSASAGGKFFEDLADRQANNPSLQYRLGGLGVMAMGLYMLSMAVVRLLRHLG